MYYITEAGLNELNTMAIDLLTLVGCLQGFIKISTLFTFDEFPKQSVQSLARRTVGHLGSSSPLNR